LRDYNIKTKDKVAIVGFADTRKYAPFDNPEFEIWGMNELYIEHDIPRVDVLFELHDFEHIKKSRRNAGEGHFKWLQEAKIPVILQEEHEDMPMSIAFPKNVIISKFPRAYFTNTVSWMMAYAIMLEYKTIHLYGINMAVDGEYSYERPSCEYFCGIAEGLGIELFIHPDSDLCKTTFLYGFENDFVLKHKIQVRIDELTERQKIFENNKNVLLVEYKQKSGEMKQHYESEIQKMEWAIQQCVGALNECKYMYQSYL